MGYELVVLLSSTDHFSGCRVIVLIRQGAFPFNAKGRFIICNSDSTLGQGLRLRYRLNGNETKDCFRLFIIRLCFRYPVGVGGLGMGAGDILLWREQWRRARSLHRYWLPRIPEMWSRPLIKRPFIFAKTGWTGGGRGGAGSASFFSFFY